MKAERKYGGTIYTFDQFKPGDAFYYQHTPHHFWIKTDEDSAVASHDGAICSDWERRELRVVEVTCEWTVLD